MCASSVAETGGPTAGSLETAVNVGAVSEIITQTLQYRVDGPKDAPPGPRPSLGTTWHMWDRQVPELVKQWCVVRFDLPGHGGAPAQPSGAVPELAERLLATLDGLGVQRFGYAGCALGAASAPSWRCAVPSGSPRSR